MQRTAPTGRKLALGLALLLLACAAILLGRLPGGSEAAAKPAAHASGAITYKQKTFSISGANSKRRLVVRCPGRLVPLGGGMTSSPPPSADGEGVYPHSYERLGVQHGYHSTVVLFDPSPSSTQARDVTLQVAVPQAEARHASPQDRVRQPGTDEDRGRHLPRTGGICSGAASSGPTSRPAAATTSPSLARSPTSHGASPDGPSASSAASSPRSPTAGEARSRSSPRCPARPPWRPAGSPLRRRHPAPSAVWSSAASAAPPPAPSCSPTA